MRSKQKSGEEVIRDWVGRTEWLTKRPEDVFKKVKQAAMREGGDFHESLEACRKRYGARG